MEFITALLFYMFNHTSYTVGDKQVAQLWQRERAKVDTYSINVQHYSQNYNIAFFDHPMGASGPIQAIYMKVFMQKTL